MKNKISEYFIQNSTLDKINVKIESVEYFVPTLRFRWFLKKNTVIEFNLEEKVLQQLYQGSNGSQKWEDIETVYKN